MIVYGFHAIEALLSSGQKVNAIHCLIRAEDDRAQEMRTLAKRSSVPWKEYQAKDRPRFEAEFKRAGGFLDDLHSSQSIFAEIAEMKPIPHLELLRIAKKKETYPLILYLDSVTDPQNLGAMLRSGAFFGIAGIVLTEQRASPLTPAAMKVSSGGFVHVPICRVPNLVRALEEAKEEGFWIVGLSEHATETLDSARLDAPLGLVVGNEESGIRQLTAKTCDYTLSIPGNGALISLNAATAAAVTLALVRDRQPNAGHDAEE